MLGYILDARCIINLAIDEIILVAHAVLGDVDGLVVRIIPGNALQLVVHAHRINRPVPISSRHLRVANPCAYALQGKYRGTLLTGGVVVNHALTVMGLQEVAGIIIHAQEVNLLRSLLKFLKILRIGYQLAAVLLKNLIDESHSLIIIAAVEAGIQHEAVGHSIIQVSCMNVLRLVGHGHLALQGVDNANLPRQVHGLVEIYGLGVCHHHDVHHLDGGRHIELLVRREVACNVAVLRNGPRLVEGCPLLYPVTEILEADFRIIHKVINQVTVQPMAVVEERQRRIEVMQGYERLNPLLDALVNQVVVVVNACLIDGTLALRQDAGPGDGNADAVYPEIMGQLQILLVLVIEIAGRVCREAAARAVHVVIPGTWASAIFPGSTFHLISSSGSTEDEVLRELRKCCHVVLPPIKLF